MEVLVVEDSRDQRIMLCAVLKKQGYTVFEASNGYEALKVLDEHESVRVVISDWMMPEMDGIQLCEAIRSSELKRYIYFILLTGNTDQEAVVKGMNQGADDFLKKPLEFNELKARLKAGARIIRLKSDLEKKIDAIEKDLQSAADTQLQLLCDPATIGNVSFNWYFKPSRFLGGDMFGYHKIDDKNISFYQLDVAGHGVPSALLSFSLNHILSDDRNGNLIREDLDTPPYFQARRPDHVVSRLNNQFQANTDAMLYFSMAYGLIDNDTGIASIALAGHPPPLLIKKDQAIVQTLQAAGVPVGMMPNMDYDTQQVKLDPGDRLFLYSDGLTECESNNGEMFGEQKVKTLLADNIDKPLDEVVKQLENRIKEWSGSDVFEDDVTFLLLEWHP
ncbi:MAG: PP2C family protein-serine/threonine phosphatase [Endozoicomonas sp.]